VFLTLPLVTWVGGRYPWRLESDLVYQSDVLDTIIQVPQGYHTDMASVPRLPFVYLAVGGKANMAAIVHDWLYDCWTDLIERVEADRVFLEAMTAMGEPGWISRRLMYAGVRAGGGNAWRTDTRHKCPAQ
jgi:hypothetical protein